MDSLTDLELESLARQLRQRQESFQAKESESRKFEDYRQDCVGFVRKVLGADPWEKQEQIMRSVQDHPYTAVRSCHGAGKTWTAAAVALWFLQTRPGSVVITTAPSGRQVRDLLWRQIRTNFERSRTPLLGRCMTMMLECGTDWYAIGFSTDEPVNFQGPHSPKGVLFIGDEASGLAEWIFDTARGFMTQNDAKMLLIGNPNQPSGSFYEAFGSVRWQPHHVSAFDVPAHILRPDWKEEMLDDFGADSPVYQVRVLGNFPFQAENSLFDMTWVEAAMDRSLEPDGRAVIGVDIARYGTDESCAFVRRGAAVVDFRHWQGKDTMKSAGIVGELCRKHWPKKVLVDDIGIGSGTLDRLKELGWPAQGVNSNTAPRRKEDFFNLRAEQYAQLADRFRDGEISLPPDRKLMAQLVGLTYEHTSKGQRKLIGKEDLKRKGKKSPDRADALMICFAENVGAYRARSMAANRESGQRLQRRERDPAARPQERPPRPAPVSLLADRRSFLDPNVWR